MNPRIRIRVMQRSDVSACDELRRIIGWNQRIEDWHIFLRFAPDGCFVAELDGRFAGTVTTIDYEKKIGWIGMLIVHPSCRGTGVGSTLLNRAIEHLRANQVQTIKLDATPQGEPLYTRIGFEKEGRIIRWLAKPPFPGDLKGARSMADSDLDRVISLDSAAFGARRREMIEAMRREALVSVIDEAGFALLRLGANANYLGPVAAERDATALIISALASAPPREVIWDLPELPGRADLARRLGFAQQRVLTRMRLGDPLEGDIERYWGLLDPACG